MVIKSAMATNGVHTAPTIPPNYFENGREYHGFRAGMYMYPCDEREKERMDIFHKFFLVARQEKLHRAPIVPNPEPPRILDLGTGTGIWAIDMADKYPDAEVIGLDLVNIQPQAIPPLLRFRVPRDYESPWGLGEESFDLIHMRMGSGSVSSWPELYQKIFLHLKPGYGSMEQVEIDFQPRCDDGTLPFWPILRWYENLAEATNRAARPIAYQHSTGSMLQTQGFVDIQEEVIRIPYNTWPVLRPEKDRGRWYNLGMSEGLEAMSVGPFSRMFNWPLPNILEFVQEITRVMANRDVHAYNNIHIWTARRPAR